MIPWFHEAFKEIYVSQFLCTIILGLSKVDSFLSFYEIAHSRLAREVAKAQRFHLEFIGWLLEVKISFQYKYAEAEKWLTHLVSVSYES